MKVTTIAQGKIEQIETIQQRNADCDCDYVIHGRRSTTVVASQLRSHRIIFLLAWSWKCANMEDM